ncbi:ArnT family glycosyltransferase [Butyrivibrio proteoclasticus]|uniref:ArnT family glycosyltransferase n=1 Tax=Butyrivibrio proteoclasticus TaxID=43305 RepID=UPI00047CDB83|nr:glycosyltransferase family 39 protein [Butyrivibrio proteoclasticus]
MKKYQKTFWFALMAAFVGVITYMLFYRLGASHLIQTDEAYHATNAYEMYKQGNWIINTYRYAADYFNSKPPLCLDLMIVSYKLLGVSGFAARFPSALGGLITCIVVIAFLLYNKKLYSAAIFPMMFAACSSFFTFHMYRAAEMDSMYNLFFVVAMISLYMMAEKPYFMYVYGLALGLAFMCKGPHSALIFIIGLLYIPKCKNAFMSIRRVIISALLAAVIPLAWMAKRFMFDGTKLLNALFMGEVVGRVSKANQTASMPIVDFFTSHIVIIFAVMILLMAVIHLLQGKENSKAVLGQSFAGFAKENYLFIVWAVVPVLFFSFTKSFLAWYTYTAQIAMCILAANLAQFMIAELGKEKLLSKTVTVVGALVLSLIFVVPCITDDINLAGLGGHEVDQLTEDLKAFKDTYGDAYSGKNAYLIANFLVNESNDGHWEPEYVAPAEMYLDVIPVDGGADNFLNDPDSILILDKDRWDEFSGVLTGHVILQDSSYLIFSCDMY